MSNFITIKKLKELTNGIIKIKPEYANISDNYSPTYREIREGKFFNRFIDNENPSFIIVGLRVNNKKYNYNDCYSLNDEDVEVVYPKLNYLKIEEVEYIPPCGIITDIECTAKFDIITKTLFKETNDEIRCGNVTAILKSSNPLFKLKGSTVTVDANLTGEERKSTITANYTYSGTNKTDSTEIVQEENKISDWIYDYDSTNSIQLSVTPDNFINKGGQGKIRVVRYYSKHYNKKDSCGKLVDTSATTCHRDDISTYCQYHNTNDEHFVRNGTTIIAKKQEFNSPAQSSIVTATYKDFNSTAIITQDRGGNVTYTFDLQFLESDTKILLKELETSLLTTIEIPLITNKNMLVDGEYFSSIVYDDLKLKSRDNWYDAELIDDDGDIKVKIDVKEINRNKTNQRLSEIIIRNEEADKEIMIHIIQPQSKLIKSVWELHLTESGRYTVETIKEAKVIFKPYKKDIYEDGTWDVYDILDNDVRVTYDYTSSNKEVLEGGPLKRRNFAGLHEMRPIYHNNIEMEDVTLMVYGFIEDKYGDVLAESNSINITLEGVDLTNVTYELCFEDGQHYNELIWNHDETDTKKSVIKSIKNTFVNGVKTKEEPCDFKIKPVGDWGTFSFILKDNYIDCKPFGENKSIVTQEYEYKIIQNNNEENERFINLYLTQHANNSHKNVEVIVKAHKKVISENYWINDGAIMTIYKNEDKYKVIPLSSCWLYPNIIDNSDIIYKGNIDLQLGQNYDFIIRNIRTGNTCVNGNLLDNVEYNIILDENVNKIEIVIEL